MGEAERKLTRAEELALAIDASIIQRRFADKLATTYCWVGDKRMTRLEAQKGLNRTIGISMELQPEKERARKQCPQCECWFLPSKDFGDRRAIRCITCRTKTIRCGCGAELPKKTMSPRCIKARLGAPPKCSSCSGRAVQKLAILATRKRCAEFEAWIRFAYAFAGVSSRNIAKAFSVSQRTVLRVLHAQ